MCTKQVLQWIESSIHPSIPYVSTSPLSRTIPPVRVVVLVSGKRDSFVAGADITEIYSIVDPKGKLICYIPNVILNNYCRLFYCYQF